MSRLVPACSRCNGPLTKPLPPDLLDPRLRAEGLIMCCEKCGRAERVDLTIKWRALDEE